MPDPVPYGVLRQRHAEYDGDLWCEIDDLYRGGYHLARRAKDYLPAMVGENPERHSDRIANGGGYLNYLGEIVDEFTSELFAQELVVTDAADADDAQTPGGPSDKDFWQAFAKDADLAGAAFADVERCALRTALLKGRSLIAADFPTLDEQAAITSRADEDSIGANRGYVFELPLEQVINWKKRPRGSGFEWLVIHRDTTPQGGPTDRAAVTIHEFKVWTVSEGGTARWDLYQLKKDKGERPRDDDMVPWVDGGDTSFPWIPVVEMCLPDGLWIGNQIGGLCLEHHQRRTSLNAAENKSLAAIPYVKLGPEIPEFGGAIPAEAAQNPHRGHDPKGAFDRKGYVVIGKDDEIGFAEPEGKSYELAAKRLKELKDEIFRVSHRMISAVDNSSAVHRRSGESKQSDRAITAIVLTGLGKIVRQHAKSVYDTVAAGRNEKVIWTPRGLDRYDATDRPTVIAEAVQVDLVSIPSPTFKKAYKTQLAIELTPNLPAETQDVIRQEIEDGVDAEVELKATMDKARVEAAKNPPKPIGEDGAAEPGGPGDEDE